MSQGKMASVADDSLFYHTVISQSSSHSMNEWINQI